jgi:two-component SAPR family response regulator
MTVEGPPPVLQGRRVLVVEDQYLIAEEIRRAVTSLGGEVLGPVPRVDEARRLTRERKPDVAVLDVNLDDAVVYPLARDLRRLQVRLVFATGYDRSNLAPDFKHAPHVDKPVTAWSLAAALQHGHRRGATP